MAIPPVEEKAKGEKDPCMFDVLDMLKQLHYIILPLDSYFNEGGFGSKGQTRIEFKSRQN